LKVLFKSGANTFKANMHSHTTLSDGKLTPAQMKELYKSEGYHIVAFTDHNVFHDHSELCDSDFLAINGIEVDIYDHVTPKIPGAKLYHFNMYATATGFVLPPSAEKIAYDDLDAINRYIAERNAEDWLICYNHPYWSQQSFRDYGGLKGLFSMEIYNHGCEVEGLYGYNPQVYDELLRENLGVPFYCFSTDDNHNRAPRDSKDWDSFGGWIRLNSASLSYADVMTSLKAGDFYSSQGPEIYEIALVSASAGDKLVVKCSPCATVVVYTHNRKCKVAHGSPELTEVEFALTGAEKYVRVVCRDSTGRDACSNAFWVG